MSQPPLADTKPRATSPGALSSPARALRAVALASGVYDALIGIAMLLGRDVLVAWFGVAPPAPPIHADLNGVFALAIAAGYALPYRDPARYRAYLWLMGPCLKGAGTALFLADYCLRGSPASYLLFAAGDGTLALVTLWALRRSGVSRTGRTGSTPEYPAR
ncbi:MAG: hypothetical protein NTY02_01790 [Acidobacteria bacterium]|nr:hypothetical protein [Acidobacteriota bacterium]